MFHVVFRVITGIVLAFFAAQSQSGKLEFEVTSVRIAPPAGPGGRMGFRGGPSTGDPTRLAIDNYPVILLVMRAYDVSPFQISGQGLLGSGRFNITATIPAGATKEQFRVMLQNLLADRFQLKLHHEIKEVSTYEMTVAKGGVKFREHEGEAPQESVDGPGPIQRDKNGNRMFPPNSWVRQLQNGVAQDRFNGVNVAMEDFVKDLSRSFARPVIDATGLKGKYDFLLVFSSSASDPAAGASDPDSLPTLTGALQQLGLKLESKKGPVDVLVIDRCEKVPTEN